VVFAFVRSVRIWKQYQLGVRVHGYVSFNDVFVISDKASNCFHFRFRLWIGSTVCLLAFVGRCSFPCNKKACSFTPQLLPFCISVCLVEEQSVMLIHKKLWTLPCKEICVNLLGFLTYCTPEKIGEGAQKKLFKD